MEIDSTQLIIGGFVLLSLALVGATTLSVKLLDKLKQMRQGNFSLYPKSEKLFEQMLSDISKLDITSKERIIHSCYSRPCIVSKLIDKNMCWILGTSYYNPKEEDIPPKELDKLIKEQTG